MSTGRRLFGEVAIAIGEGGATVHGPQAGFEVELEPTPEALRAFVRLDARGFYRPLSGFRNLRGGWRVGCTEALPLEAALEQIYPLALTHIGQRERGELRVVGLDEVLERQSGRYQAAARLSQRGRSIVVHALCGSCVRQPIWTGAASAEDEIPCPEPCSVLVSLCREAALWEEDMPSAAPPAGHAQFAAFDVPGNALREQVIAAMSEDRRP